MRGSPIAAVGARSGRAVWDRAVREQSGRERGNGVLEAALVMPLFLLLVFGAVEGGYGLHERLSVGNMGLAGARTASSYGAEALSDYQVLAAVRGGSGGVAASQVTTIVVYKATGPSQKVPTSCKTASVAAVCNRYTGADLSRPTTDFGCTGPPVPGPAIKIDNSWCPTARKTSLSGVNGPPDYIGVYILASHRNLTGVLGTGITFEADTVLRIEPRTLL
jgi:hypothetical protein